MLFEIYTLCMSILDAWILDNQHLTLHSFCLLDTFAIHQRMLEGEIIRQFSVTVCEEEVKEVDIINIGLS
jgi:hypothetical protein